jgi:hypothetical protein
MADRAHSVGNGAMLQSPFVDLEKNPFSKPYSGLLGQDAQSLQSEDIGKTAGFRLSWRLEDSRRPSKAGGERVSQPH